MVVVIYFNVRTFTTSRSGHSRRPARCMAKYHIQKRKVIFGNNIHGRHKYPLQRRVQT